MTDHKDWDDEEVLAELERADDSMFDAFSIMLLVLGFICAVWAWSVRS